MNLELNNNTYDLRAESKFQEILLKIRAWVYEHKIIKSILETFDNKKIEGNVIDIGGGQGDKTKIIDKYLIGKSGKLTLVEPSNGMRKKAEIKLSETKIHIERGDAFNLDKYINIETIFANQMTHHLNDEEKLKAFKQFYKSLKTNGKLIILDSIKPEWFIGGYIFDLLLNGYKKFFGKNNNYHNITSQEYINLLESVGFEIDLKNTKHFYIFGKLGEMGHRLKLVFPFMTHIVAIKK